MNEVYNANDTINKIGTVIRMGTSLTKNDFDKDLSSRSPLDTFIGLV
jgi:hypothetical protein